MSTVQFADAPQTTPETPRERDARGRFAAGNSGGPGNPFGRRMATMREGVMQAISVQDVIDLMRDLLALAKAGDIAAARLVLQYAVGKPKPVVEPDCVEVDAWNVMEKSWVASGRCQEVMTGIPVELASVMAEAVAQSKVNEIGQALINPAAREEFFAKHTDEEDRPLTAEEIAEARREWAEANARFEAESARANPQPAVQPSPTGSNGDSAVEQAASLLDPGSRKRQVYRPAQAVQAGSLHHETAVQPSPTGSIGDSATLTSTVQPSVTGSNGRHHPSPAGSNGSLPPVRVERHRRTA